jgi:hypothetical protein
MNAGSKLLIRSMPGLISTCWLLSAALTLPQVAIAHDDDEARPTSAIVNVSLSEWKVQLTPDRVQPGPVILQVTNSGTIPHAFEVEGGSLEKTTPQIQPGATATLKLDLRSGNYEAYCPVGKGSHKMLGMESRLTVGNPERSAASEEREKEEARMTAHESAAGHASAAENGSAMAHESALGHEMVMAHDDADEKNEYVSGAKLMRVTGGGPVIQILPGPFPFADSAMAIINSRPADQQADLTHKAHMGPYSNVVAKTSGDISLVAIDRGASGDSVSGVAQFTSQDGARWKVVMDRVQTKDVPFNPRFGGVIMGLFYHGASGVHTPLVPTIQSSLALWAFAHLYKNDQLVTDNAMVHIMLLSRTRRTSDWALDCWDCSDRPIEELQLQVTPAPDTPPFDAPGGFLFVNWEKSTGQRQSL